MAAALMLVTSATTILTAPTDPTRKAAVGFVKVLHNPFLKNIRTVTNKYEKGVFKKMFNSKQKQNADLKSFNVEMEVAFPEISSAIETMSVLMDLMNSTAVSCLIQFSILLLRITKNSRHCFNAFF